MRKFLIAPMVLLLGGTAPPPAPFLLELNARFCGDPVQAADTPIILTGYGTGGFAIRTSSPQAQAFFNNGMQLAHAFAHKAAIAAFQEARRLDPDCAMCAWGEAWSSGPTINYGVSADDMKKLAGITAIAEKLAAGSPENERQMIAALKLRYAGTAAEGNKAFGAAMDALAKAMPGDDELATIAADALMVATDDYDATTLARPVELLETVLKRNPDYTPAIHFYIHATEGAGYPARAEPFADKLRGLAPAASHLVHMPSHTYYWIGRYADAATANVRAVALGHENAARLKLPEPDGVWQLSYHGHNVHFGIGGALMAGDAVSGLALARPMVAMLGRVGKMNPFRQLVFGEAFVAIAHFAPTAEMLAVADPGDANPAAQALWHYARGEALARAGDIKGVQREARAIPRRLKDDPGGAATKLFAVSRLVLKGRVAMLRGKHDKAAKAFAKAAAIEEAKPLAGFSDPPIWWYPVRRDVAAALLAGGDAQGARDAADASLKHRPRDPVALGIRAQAESRLGNIKAAAADRADARRGWRGDRAAIG
jgi:tetratricopeptide (TPR) repeat protein